MKRPSSIGRASRRPAWVKAPEHLSPSPPVPEAAEAAEAAAAEGEEHGGPKGPEPTRYGDWENEGICRDF